MPSAGNDCADEPAVSDRQDLLVGQIVNVQGRDDEVLWTSTNRQESRCTLATESFSGGIRDLGRREDGRLTRFQSFVRSRAGLTNDARKCGGAFSVCLQRDAECRRRVLLALISSIAQSLGRWWSSFFLRKYACNEIIDGTLQYSQIHQSCASCCTDLAELAASDRRRMSGAPGIGKRETRNPVASACASGLRDCRPLVNVLMPASRASLMIAR